MRAAVKRAGAAPAAFVPATETIGGAPRSGSRRSASRKAGIPLRWPTTMSERRKAVQLWRRISMILLHQGGKVMRLPAILPDAVIWKDGEIWASNWKLSIDAGGCAEKTIQREIEWFRQSGLLVVSYGWRRNQSGHLCKTRLMKLAIPDGYDGPIPSLDEPDQADTRGPDGESYQADTRGPDRLDTRGPIIGRDSDSAVEDDHAA